MKHKVSFLITAFDQIREVKFTIDMLRNNWKRTAKSPIVLVISGDFDRSITYNDDPYTRVIHVDDIVREKFKTLVSTSIMRAMNVGMLEMRDLEREHGDIDNIVHIHGDILLLGEGGFFDTIDKWRATDKPVAADPVGPHPIIDKVIFGKRYQWRFFGCEFMPQLFAVDHQFCKTTGFMYDMIVMPNDFEIKATETCLIANLYRALYTPGESSGKFRRGLYPKININERSSPYQQIFDENVFVVSKSRSQWGTHKTWGGFCHYGNDLKFTTKHREEMNKRALKSYGLDLSVWDNIQ